LRCEKQDEIVAIGVKAIVEADPVGGSEVVLDVVGFARFSLWPETAPLPPLLIHAPAQSGR